MLMVTECFVFVVLVAKEFRFNLQFFGVQKQILKELKEIPKNLTTN